MLSSNSRRGQGTQKKVAAECKGQSFQVVVDHTYADACKCPGKEIKQRGAEERAKGGATALRRDTNEGLPTNGRRIAHNEIFMP